MSTGTDNQEMVERTDTRSLVSMPLPVLEHDSDKEPVDKEPVDWGYVGRQVWRCAWVSVLVVIAATGALIVAVVALVALSARLAIAVKRHYDGNELGDNIDWDAMALRNQQWADELEWRQHDADVARQHQANRNDLAAALQQEQEQMERRAAYHGPYRW